MNISDEKALAIVKKICENEGVELESILAKSDTQNLLELVKLIVNCIPDELVLESVSERSLDNKIKSIASSEKQRKTSTSEIEELLSKSFGGAGKRLDEHREFVELLQQKAPSLLIENFWIRGWLQAQDSYLESLFKLADNKQLIPSYWRGSIRSNTLKDNASLS